MNKLIVLSLFIFLSGVVNAAGISPKQAETFIANVEEDVKIIKAYRAGYKEALKCVEDKGLDMCKNSLSRVDEDTGSGAQRNEKLL